MLRLKTLFLITIASKAYSAPENFADYYMECDVNIDTISTQKELEGHFLKGECDKFNKALAKLDDCDVKWQGMIELIHNNYTGNLTMAENIYNCLSKLSVGYILDIYMDKAKGFIALNSELTAKYQRATLVSLKVGISMSEINSELKPSFRSPELEILEGYVDRYMKEALPSIKSMCFDAWVKIKHPEDNTELAIDEYNNVDMWPIDTSRSRVTEDSFKWFVEREFKTNIYGFPVIDVTLTNVGKNRLLESNKNGDVFSSLVEWKKNGTYHWWTAEFVEENTADDVKFRFKNKQTCKYLKTNEYHTSQDIRVQSMTTDRNSASYFIIH